MTDGTATAHLYLPKLYSVLREGYHLQFLKKDVLAALTVAIVALPLSMAIAVGSGVSPERGLYAAIVGGAVVSALSGSRFQIGGPAGAFIVLVSTTVHAHGVDGLLLTVFLSGMMLTLSGLLKIGSLIRYVPHTVTVGFTSGIAVTIAASQLKDLGGLRLADEPGALVPKLGALWQAIATLNAASLAVGLATVTTVFLLRWWRPNWPGMLIAVIGASAAATFWSLPVETVGSRFGALPGDLPVPHTPRITLDLILAVLPTALSFTLLGGLESLLSAKVADAMTGRKHRSNMELVGQGIANMASALFGGITVTGTIARTATNIRAGAISPLSGIFHAVFLLLFLMVAAPLASFIPLSALAGLLIVVCWNMAEKREFKILLSEWPTATVLLVTFGGTVLFDITMGVTAGCVAATAGTVLKRIW
jgi:sulfate permease, SulP family